MIQNFGFLEACYPKSITYLIFNLFVSKSLVLFARLLCMLCSISFFVCHTYTGNDDGDICLFLCLVTFGVQAIFLIWLNRHRKQKKNFEVIEDETEVWIQMMLKKKTFLIVCGSVHELILNISNEYRWQQWRDSKPLFRRRLQKKVMVRMSINRPT